MQASFLTSFAGTGKLRNVNYITLDHLVNGQPDPEPQLTNFTLRPVQAKALIELRGRFDLAGMLIFQ